VSGYCKSGQKYDSYVQELAHYYLIYSNLGKHNTVLGVNCSVFAHTANLGKNMKVMYKGNVWIEHGTYTFLTFSVLFLYLSESMIYGFKLCVSLKHYN
jgi:hypothetical protein